MRDVLAERLLAAVMGWTAEDVARERPDLEALATFKYDEYQQFSPGMRFIESLALWLEQFGSEDERRQAFEFVRSRIVFISNAEMAHLVSIAFPDVIRPYLIRLTAVRLGVSERLVAKLANAVEFRVMLRQSLFLGLSDGAHTDLFRRCNPDISHEQVWQTYEVPDTKAGDMLAKLSSDLQEQLGREPSEAEKRFRALFLLDDFSGSGLSYLRRAVTGEQPYEGKIDKIFRGIAAGGGHLNNLFDPTDLHICIVLYVATAQALSHLRSLTSEWLQEYHINNECSVLPVQTLQDSIRLRPKTDLEFIRVLKAYFDESVIDKHYRKGKHDEPYLGFDECALPLVLSHNAPNNSIPLLWFEEGRAHRGLFPRVSRHRATS